MQRSNFTRAYACTYLRTLERAWLVSLQSFPLRQTKEKNGQGASIGKALSPKAQPISRVRMFFQVVFFASSLLEDGSVQVYSGVHGDRELQPSSKGNASRRRSPQRSFSVPLYTVSTPAPTRSQHAQQRGRCCHAH